MADEVSKRTWQISAYFNAFLIVATVVLIALTIFYAVSYNQCRASITKAICRLSGGTIEGFVRFSQPVEGGQVTVNVDVTKVPQGPHGFHVHQFGDLSNGCSSCGPHYNPQSVNHGGPTSSERHNGDLGNLNADAVGKIQKTLTDDVISLSGPNSIIGRSIVINLSQAENCRDDIIELSTASQLHSIHTQLHAGADDLGQGGSPLSSTSGNSGDRLACGVIGIEQ